MSFHGIDLSLRTNRPMVRPRYAIDRTVGDDYGPQDALYDHLTDPRDNHRLVGRMLDYDNLESMNQEHVRRHAVDLKLDYISQHLLMFDAKITQGRTRPGELRRPDLSA